MHTRNRHSGPHPGQTTLRAVPARRSSATTLTGRLLAIGRTCWPHADFRDRHAEIRWTDGPNYGNVLTAAARAGITAEDLDWAGIALRRTVSSRLLAYATLATDPADVHLNRARGLVDDLLRFPTPETGPPALPHPAPDLERLWRRAASLVHLDGDRPPFPTDDRAAILRRLRRLKRLTAMAGPDALDRGVTLIPITSISPHAGATRIAHTSQDAGDHRCAVRIERWPDRLFTATTALDSDEPSPGLHWIDGPTAEQVRTELGHRGLPSPLEGCRSFTLHRSLSATAIAASVLLHQHLVGKPYRDTAIGYHWMQQWKVASVRDIARREAPIRARLEHLQHQLLARPLPTTDELTMTRQDGTPTTIDGAYLWARAEVLHSLLEPRPEPDTGHTPGHGGTRQVSLDLAGLLSDIQAPTLDLLVAGPRP